MPSIFKLGELFCWRVYEEYHQTTQSPGGIGYAAKSAAITDKPEFRIIHAWANDYDQNTCLTYQTNIAKDSSSVICKDIRKLDIPALRTISDIDALAFGFPCNDFSVVGEQKGFDGEYGPSTPMGSKPLKSSSPAGFWLKMLGD